jgi:hypothetical protein
VSTPKADTDPVIALVRAAIDHERELENCKTDAELARKKGMRKENLARWGNGRSLGAFRTLGPWLCRACIAQTDLATKTTEPTP